MQRQDLEEDRGLHDGPGRVQLRDGGGVEVGDEEVEEVGEMLDTMGAGSQVVVSRY